MNQLTQALLYCLAGTGFTFFCTAAGAAVVFLFKKEIKVGFQRVFLGFAAGVMIAASVWSREESLGFPRRAAFCWARCSCLLWTA